MPNGKVKDAIYKIYRFDVFEQKTKKSKDKEKRRLRQNFNYIKEVDFFIELTDKFLSKNHNEIIEFAYSINPKTFLQNNYKEKLGWIDITKEMLKDELGLIIENQWMYYYHKVPRSNQALIDFYDSQKFPFDVKIVKTI